MRRFVTLTQFTKYGSSRDFRKKTKNARAQDIPRIFECDCSHVPREMQRTGRSFDIQKGQILALLVFAKNLLFVAFYTDYYTIIAKKNMWGSRTI